MTTGHLTLAAMPLVGALIGWATNWLAVKMIFRPRRPVRVLGMEWIGLLPKRRRQLAEKLAETIESELLSSADLTEILEDPEVHAHVSRALESRLDEFVQRMFERLPTMVQALIPRERMVALRNAMLEEIGAHLPAIATSLVEQVEQRVDIRQKVIDRVEAFEIERLEALVLGIVRAELRHIELLGGLLGFLVGLAQAALLYATGALAI